MHKKVHDSENHTLWVRLPPDVFNLCFRIIRNIKRVPREIAPIILAIEVVSKLIE